MRNNQKGAPVFRRRALSGISALALMATGVLATSPAAEAQTTQWNGSASSDWFHAPNWNSGVPGPWTAGGLYPYNAIINGAGSPAAIGSAGAEAGTLVVGGAAAGRLDITAGGTLTVNGYAGSGVFSLLIGDQASGDGTVTASGAGASLSAAGIAVGRAGTGRLEVLNGALVGSSLGYVGVDAGSHGTAVVDAATWNIDQLFVGSYGTGDLTLQSGGKATVASNLGATAGMYANSVGTITVDGAGSVLDEQQGWLSSMTLGYNGTGHLIVSNGGTVTSFGTCMGCGTGGVGTALVTGAGSKWQFTDSGYEYSVGGSGTGTLTVADGGLFQADNSGLVVTFGSVATGHGTLHLMSGGKAQFDTLNLGMWIGAGAGSVGEALVESGGQLSSKSGNIGGAAGALGKVTVTGTGSRWDHTGPVTLGYKGHGELTVSAGGQVASQSAVIASDPGSTGTATVTGAGSKWGNTQYFMVGNRGVASLFVQNGGEVETGSLSVGPGGQGSVEISGGGRLTTSSVMLGTNGTAGTAMSPTTGDLLVSGAGSSLVASTYLWAGSQGARGSLTIADGGTVSLNNGVFDPGTYGGVLYLGDDSVAGSAGTLNIGGAGAAAAPGTLTAAGVAFNTLADTLNFNHTASNYAFAPDLAGLGIVDARAGTTHLTGDGSDFFGQVNVLGGKLYVDNRLGGGAGGAGPVAVAAGGLLGGIGTIAGAVTVADGGILEGRGGQVLTIGSLALNPNSNVNVALGAPSTEALFSVSGALTLDGRLTVSNAGGFTNGSYRLFDYGGALTDNGLVIQSLPAGFNPGDWSIDSATGGRVSLVVQPGPGEQYWDSTNMAPGGVANGRGGPGTWNATNTNWTNQPGTINAPWAGGVAVFSNAAVFVPGNTYGVTVDAAGVTAAGLKAINTDIYTYTFSGGTITLKPGATITTGANGFAFRSNLDTLGSLLVTGSQSPVRINDGTGTMAGPLTVDDGSLRIEAASAGGGGFTHPVVRLPGDAVTVGAAGAGKLFVNQGSSLFSQGGTLGALAGSSGAVDVSNGSIWDAGAGDLVIGAAGTGTLRVLGNAPSQLKAANIVLGQAATGRGTLTILDAPTAITAARVLGGIGGGEVIFDGGPTQGLFAPVLSGNLSVSIKGSEVHLAGAHDHTGPTTVSGNGALILDGAHLTQSNVAVAVATLGGYGTIDGAVGIASFGHLKGESGRTLAMGSLVLGDATSVDVTLGAPSAQSLFSIGGNLTLDGQLRVTAAPGYGDGVYRLFDYGGALTDNGLAVASLPSGSSSATVQTAIARQVNLVVGSEPGPGPDPVPATQFWNGTTTTADGTIHGGNGTWIAGPTNWTDANGTRSDAWNSRFAVFQNNPGTVTVDNAAGAIATTGMQFVGAGWTVGGGPITLAGAGGSTLIRVGDGSAAGASHAATIAAELTGASRLVKDDLGTLILTGANSYTGGTTVANGTLRIGNGGTTGAILGDVLNNGSLVFDRSDATTFGGTITGSGALRQIGAGRTGLSGNSSGFAGTTTVENGILAVNGQLGGGLAVSANGRLQGSGTVGDTSVAGGGTLEGRAGQVLTLRSLVLNAGSQVDVALGAPGGAGLFAVSGDLTLAGTLNVADAGGFGRGLYRIFDYGGTLTDNGLAVGTLPSDTGTVQTAVAHQVNLLVEAPGPGPVPATQFWNGTTTVADGTIHGGSGSWIAGPTNWTDANGTRSDAWNSRFAVFQNNPGTVTVDNAAGAIATTGMQFVGASWTVGGGPITLAGASGSTLIRVGDGSAAGASHVATIAAELTGGSRLVKDDLGTLILTGANSYAGGTTVANGTLRIGNGGTTGAILGDVLNNGSLVFDRSDATTFGGTITGSGGVRLASGDLTVTADSSYAFGTEIAAGATLRLGNGGTSGSIVGRVANAGTLAFNRSDDLAFAGFLTGNGALRQIGAGKTELTGDSSGFAGATSVENGTLAVNGKLGGTIDVRTAGRLQGAGTVGETIVSGTIAPGNSIGTLEVAGGITFKAGSIYEVEVNAAGQSDRIAATGAAKIEGGAVKVLAGAGTYAPATTYTILAADGGRTGSFGEGVTSNLAFLDPSLGYDANNVYLTMTRNALAFNNVGITPNQIATGGGVESLGLGNAVYDAVLNLSAPQARHAFDQLSGEIHASAKTALIEDSRFIRNAVNDRIRAAFDGVGAAKGGVVTYVDGKPVPVAATTDRFAVWGEALGSWGHTDGNGNAAKLDRRTSGFFIGADAPVFGGWRLGAVAGYSATRFDVKDRHSSGESDNYHLGLYGGTQWGDLAFRAGAAYAWHDVSTSRNAIFPGFGNSLRGDYNAATAQIFGEMAYGFSMGGARFEPFASLAYVNLRTDGFSERGGAAALTARSATTDATFTTLGLRASTDFTIGGAMLTAKGMLGWRHAFGDVTPFSTMRFAGGGNAFSIGGVPIARDAAVVEAGLDHAITPNATFGVSYGGQFASGVTDQTFRANFRMKF